MKLSADHITELLDLAIATAKKAGTLIENFPKEKLVVKDKIGGESLASQVVTEVDILAQNLILEELNTSILRFDLGLLTEELVDDSSRFEKDYFWCIDPLDGTLPFTEQVAGYSVSISLVSKEGKTILGVIYEPKKEDVYYASLGKGGYKNHKKWMLSYGTDLTLVCDRSFLKHNKYQETIRELRQEAIEKGLSKLNVIDFGGAAMNAMWVLEYAPAIYMKYPKKELGGGSLWDYASSCCIFNELGLNVTDYFGEPLNLNTPSTFMNEVGVIFKSS